MKLHLYRLSLTAADYDLFSDGSSRESRVSFLSRMLSAEFDFETRKGKILRYKPTQNDDGLMSGAVCRWMPESYEGDPSDPFGETDGGRWAKASFFLNVNDDQQVVGFERVSTIGKPGAVMKGLVNELNERAGGRPYRIDVFSVNVEQSFQKAVSLYSGPVTSLSFDLVLPNPTDGEGATKEALKRLRDKVNADRAKATVVSSDGLNTTDGLVKDAVEYAETGGGDVVAKDGRHVVFSSKNTVKTVDVDDSYRPDGTEIDGLKTGLSGKLER
jgi:hypothetical protein